MFDACIHYDYRSWLNILSTLTLNLNLTLALTLTHAATAMSSGLVLGLDSWVYELLTVMVAQMGTIAVDAHQILIIIIRYIYIYHLSA